MTEVLTAISTLGFPIVACVCLGWYVKYQTDSYRNEVRDLQKEHREEINKMTEALNNNTQAIEKLIYKIDGGNKE